MSRFHPLPAPAAGPGLPRVREIVRHAAPRVLQATLIPTAAFLGANAVWGLAGGLAAALTWSWGCIAWRLVTGRSVGGLLPIGALGLSIRTVVALLSHSAFIYFAAPAVVMTVSGFVILASAATTKPLIGKVVTDVVPLPRHVLERGDTQRLMRQLSALWGAEQMACAAVNLWLLRNLPTARYLMVRAPAGWALAGTALACSLAAGRRHLAITGAPAAPAEILPLDPAPLVAVA